MTLMKSPVSVELTFEDGSVMHFKHSTKDGISMSSHLNGEPPYYALILTPVAKSKKDEI